MLVMFSYQKWLLLYSVKHYLKKIILNIDRDIDKFKFFGNGHHYWLPANFQ